MLPVTSLIARPNLLIEAPQILDSGIHSESIHHFKSPGSPLWANPTRFRTSHIQLIFIRGFHSPHSFSFFNTLLQANICCSEYGPNDLLIRVIAASSNPKDWKHPHHSMFDVAVNQGDDCAGIVQAVGSAAPSA